MKHSADPYVSSALANQKRQRSEQRAFVIDSGLEHQTADQASEQEPMLPKGYLHIRSAIRALLSAETDLQGCAKEIEAQRIRALDRIHEAINDLRQEMVDRGYLRVTHW